MNKLYALIISLFFWIAIGAQEHQNISIVIENGKYYATNVKVNNTLIKGKFLIDTGAETIITKELASMLGLKATEKTQEFSDGYLDKELQGVKIDFELDNILIKSVKANIIDEPKGFVCNEYGVIGNDMLKNHAWHFTKDSIRVLFDVKEFVNGKNYKREKLILKGGAYPYVIATLSKPTATTLFDTGDNCLFAITESEVRYLNNYSKLDGAGIGSINAFSNDTNTYAIKTNLLIVSGLTISNPIAYVDAKGQVPMWAIGSEFMDYFDVILDFPSKKYYLNQIKEEYDKGKSWGNSFGFKYLVNNNKALVQFVWDNSSAKAVGMKPNDTILQINSLDLRNLKAKPCETYTKIDSEINENDELMITIHNGEETKTLQLRKTDLFEDQTTSH